MERLNEKAATYKKDLARIRERATSAVERNRANILLALASGLNKSEVSRALHHARSTVIRAAQAVEAHGLARATIKGPAKRHWRHDLGTTPAPFAPRTRDQS